MLSDGTSTRAQARIAVAVLCGRLMLCSLRRATRCPPSHQPTDVGLVPVADSDAALPAVAACTGGGGGGMAAAAQCPGFDVPAAQATAAVGLQKHLPYRSLTAAVTKGGRAVHAAAGAAAGAAASSPLGMAPLLPVLTDAAPGVAAG